MAFLYFAKHILSRLLSPAVKSPKKRYLGKINDLFSLPSVYFTVGVALAACH